MAGCFHPFFKRVNGDDDYRVPLPCGHCEYCRYRQAKTWTFRLSQELENWNNKALFVTLTYDNEHCPEGYNLKPTDLQGFFKRLRYYLTQRYGKDFRIRYYSCGEYGDRRGRPHYHAIIYNLTESDIDLVNNAWYYGAVRKPVAVRGEGAIQYVAGYVQKKIGKQREHIDSYGGRYPFFARMSKGLGLKFLEKLNSFTPYVYVGSKVQFLGRYLTTKLAEKFGVLEQYKELAFKAFYEKYVEIYEKSGYFTSNFGYAYATIYKPESRAYDDYNLQFKRDFLARQKIFSKSRSLDEKIQV